LEVLISHLIKHLVLDFSPFNVQIPSSQDTTDSPVDAIPKKNDRLIDWSQVRQIHIPTLLIQAISIVCKAVIEFYALI